MAQAPVVISIDGQELVGYTEMALRRSKDEMTGELSVSLFMGYMPNKPILMNAARGREILVYVGGHLAFTGKIDKRQDAGIRHGEQGSTRNERPTGGSGSQSLSIGPNEYTVKLTARGKTKYLIDSSHQHPTTNMLQPSTRQVAEKLVEPWGTQIEWDAEDIKLDKVRFRDGARVVDELQRLATEHGYYLYETRDGKLKVTDKPGQRTGEAIVLGTNILEFSTEQAEDMVKSKIKIKGQRIEKKIWGQDAVLKSETIIQDQWVQAEIPITVQHYGNGTPEALQRRGKFEANKRSSMAKKISVDVFHVQSTSGEPWDIGTLHYVEIPPAGIFDVMECIEVAYTVQNDKTLKTTLTLSPPPAEMGGRGSGGGPTSNLPEATSDLFSMGSARRAAAGVTFAPGQFPSPWSGPALSVLQVDPIEAIQAAGEAILSSLESMDDRPPLKLPPGLDSGDGN